jgi:hypothetical protein
MSGSVTYNGYSAKECVVGRTAVYVDQVDNHIAELTVRETLDFAARVQGAGFGARQPPLNDSHGGAAAADSEAYEDTCCMTVHCPAVRAAWLHVMQHCSWPSVSWACVLGVSFGFDMGFQLPAVIRVV